MNSAKKLPVPVVEQKKEPNLHGNGIKRRDFMKIAGGALIGLSIPKKADNLFAYLGKEGKGKEGKDIAPTSPLTQTPAPVTAISAQGRGRLEFNNFIVVVAPEPEETIRFYGPNLGRVEDIKFKHLLRKADDAPDNQVVFIRLPDFSLKTIELSDKTKQSFKLQYFEKNTLISGVKTSNNPNTYFYLLPPGSQGIHIAILPPGQASDKIVTRGATVNMPIDAVPQTLLLSSGAFALVDGKQVQVFVGDNVTIVPGKDILDIYNEKQTDSSKKVLSFNTISLSEMNGQLGIKLDTLPIPFVISPVTGDYTFAEGR